MADNDNSPLSEAQPDSFQELFERINEKLAMGLPEQIDISDIAKMVDVLRNQRKVFLSEQDRLGRAPPARRKAKPQSVQQALEVEVDDLDI